MDSLKKVFSNFLITCMFSSVSIKFFSILRLRFWVGKLGNSEKALKFAWNYFLQESLGKVF